jgi:VanZ family protein
MKLKSLWPVVLWAIAILGLHVIPSRHIPEPPDWSISEDKLVHFFLFAGLSFLMLRYKHLKLGKWDGGMILTAIILASLYGLAMEMVQLAIPGRKFDLVDLVADILGVLAGNFIYVRFVKLIKGVGQ